MALSRPKCLAVAYRGLLGLGGSTGKHLFSKETETRQLILLTLSRLSLGPRWDEKSALLIKAWCGIKNFPDVALNSIARHTNNNFLCFFINEYHVIHIIFGSVCEVFVRYVSKFRNSQMEFGYKESCFVNEI